MLPLLTFATGLVAGIAGVRLLKSAKFDALATPSAGDLGKTARAGFDRARSGLRVAAVSGLSAVEKTSAGLREKLAPDDGTLPAAPAAAADTPAAVETVGTVAPPKARRAPRKATKAAEAAS